MLLNKTGKARDALREGAAAGLDLQARRILILVDGKRSLDQVMAMLGGDILPTIDRLLREGYLARGEQSDSGSRTNLGGAVTDLVRAAADVVQARADQIRAGALPPTDPAAASPRSAVPAPVTAAAPAAPRPAGARRSLAACKMYLLDMLQLQRTPEAAELRATIQCTIDPALLVDVLLQALRLIVATTNASYGERVTQRLLEILPLDALPRMEALRGERSSTPPSLSVVA